MKTLQVLLGLAAVLGFFFAPESVQGMEMGFMGLAAFLETKGLKESDLEGMEETKLQSIYNEFEEIKRKELKELEDSVNTLKTAAEKSVSKSDMDALKSEILETQIKAMKSINVTQEEQGKAMAKLLSGNVMSEDGNNALKAWISENAEEIKKIQKAGQGSITFKAPESITTGSATLPVAAPALTGVQSAAPGDVNLRGVIVNELVNSFPTTMAAYPYTETTPKSGDYAFVAEEGTKPQIDFKIETRWAEPKKIAAHEILTTESIQDIPNLQNIATNYLRAKHDLKRQNGILFGDGTGENPKGATVYGRTFVAGGMALSVVTPNIMDIINACVTDIYTTHNYTDEMPYLANLAMLNPVDFYTEFVSAKDANGLPLFPQASLFNRVQIGGTLIIPFQDIPSGKLFVADMSKYNVSYYVGYTVTIGWINDQLITNQFTMVGESRLHAFVKNLDEQAFIYDDIATIDTAIAVV